MFSLLKFLLSLTTLTFFPVVSFLFSFLFHIFSVLFSVPIFPRLPFAIPSTFLYFVRFLFIFYYHHYYYSLHFTFPIPPLTTSLCYSSYSLIHAPTFCCFVAFICIFKVLPSRCSQYRYELPFPLSFSSTSFYNSYIWSVFLALWRFLLLSFFHFAPFFLHFVFILSSFFLSLSLFSSILLRFVPSYPHTFQVFYVLILSDFARILLLTCFILSSQSFSSLSSLFHFCFVLILAYFVLPSYF